MLMDVISGFVNEPRYYVYGWSKSSTIKARPSVIRKLKLARTLLPRGYNFKIWDGQRTYATQLLMHRNFRRRLKKMYPRLTPKKLDQLATKFSGGLVKRITRLDTHRRGGALDLTIVDRHGDELYMGTDLDNLTIKARTNYYEHKTKLSAKEIIARRNRRLLKRVMTKAGFKNYAPEWWHWSYTR
jgi:D-alanyl-D-alanine dipeptidase